MESRHHALILSTRGRIVGLMGLVIGQKLKKKLTTVIPCLYSIQNSVHIVVHSQLSLHAVLCQSLHRDNQASCNIPLPYCTLKNEIKNMSSKP